MQWNREKVSNVASEIAKVIESLIYGVFQMSGWKSLD